jgi:putative glutamine amidotransferase
MDIAVERRMPVMGIGAGMQLLNVSQGGTLLHIAEDLPRAIPHFDGITGEVVEMRMVAQRAAF